MQERTSMQKLKGRSATLSLCWDKELLEKAPATVDGREKKNRSGSDWGKGISLKWLCTSLVCFRDFTQVKTLFAFTEVNVESSVLQFLYKNESINFTQRNPRHVYSEGSPSLVNGTSRSVCVELQHWSAWNQMYLSKAMLDLIINNDFSGSRSYKECGMPPDSLNKP